MVLLEAKIAHWIRVQFCLIDANACYLRLRKITIDFMHRINNKTPMVASLCYFLKYNQ